ncbi:hypothetical protein AXF42_Ash013797 [Apostasia shenzhenica]|uniref:BRCA1-A complex subunit Abraxas n=1 Tax=Apostasia shenzhenica TaxID=1088818 RepID=A0A2I0A4W3_9ASPA|nr:hypothetical protein AXF42_Ash013797 [Apostasia shenzhenica]
MVDESFLVEKISISGPTLSSILQRFASSSGDVDGLLFGHFTRLPPPDPHDDDPSSSSYATASSGAASSLSAVITGYFSSGSPMSFYDSIGRIDSHSLRRAAAAADDDRRPLLIGWFSARRRSPLRPSMREVSVSNSFLETLTLASAAECMPQNPNPGSCIFLLLSSSATENQAIHTHDYRAFVLRMKKSPIGARILEPRSLDIVNIGPAFRGQYGSFSPESALPWLPWKVDDELAEPESLRNLKDVAAAQRLLDSAAEGFNMERLAHLVGPGIAEYASELEDLYRKMLIKLEGLARLVEKSSARVLEQENRNLKLRCRLAGLE